MGELLIVIAIVATLCALALPAFRRALDSSRSARCMGNLRQLAAAASMYSAENNGQLIPMCTGGLTDLAAVRTWRAYMMPYLGQDRGMKVFLCPADPTQMRLSISSFSYQTGLQPTSYAINASRYANGAPSIMFHDYMNEISGRRLTAVPNPASTIFLCDTGRPDSVNDPLAQWTENRRAPTNSNFGYASMPNRWASGDFCIYPRHTGAKSNALFYDGHVAALDLASDVVAHPPGDPQCLYDYH